MADKKVVRWYVRNPVSFGAQRGLIKVVGYDETKGNTPPYVVPRGHLLEIKEGEHEAVVQKFIRNKCIEKYDAKLHPDAFLGDEPAPTDEPEADAVGLAAVKHVSQANPITDETDDLPKVDEPKKSQKGDQSKAIGGRKYS